MFDGFLTFLYPFVDGILVYTPHKTIESSHLARRTFIGNAYFMVSDPKLIGRMSGHVDGSRAFKRYGNIEDKTLKRVIDLIG